MTAIIILILPSIILPNNINITLYVEQVANTIDTFKECLAQLKKQVKKISGLHSQLTDNKWNNENTITSCSVIVVQLQNNARWPVLQS
jgi:hypothetical protein